VLDSTKSAGASRFSIAAGNRMNVLRPSSKTCAGVHSGVPFSTVIRYEKLMASRLRLVAVVARASASSRAAAPSTFAISSCG